MNVVVAEAHELDVLCSQYEGADVTVMKPLVIAVAPPSTVPMESVHAIDEARIAIL